MPEDAGNDEILVSASDCARSVGGTDEESDPDRLDDLERSATKSSASRNTRSLAVAPVSGLLNQHLASENSEVAKFSVIKH